jgi:hypothetical protein
LIIDQRLATCLLAGLGESHDDGDSVAGRSHALDCLQIAPDQVVLEQQILGRISQNGQFRGDQQIRPALCRLGDGPEDLLGVALDVADEGIDLR